MSPATSAAALRRVCVPAVERGARPRRRVLGAAGGLSVSAGRRAAGGTYQEISGVSGYDGGTTGGPASESKFITSQSFNSLRSL